MSYVLVLGYGWSGSSAVIDLLSEYKNVKSVNTEFRLIKDYGGLMDLRYHLVDNWDQLNADLAIKKFLWFSNCLGKQTSNLPMQFGLDYANVINKNYFDETKKYISNISPLDYKGHWFYFDYSKSKTRLFKERLLRKLKIKNMFEEEMHYSNITGEEFDTATKDYINSLFSEVNGKDNLVLLDQAIPTQNLGAASHFFDDYKIIVVDRDPRDIYCDLVNNNGLIGPELGKNEDVAFYKNWFLKYRKNEHEYDKRNVCFIPFEELVKNYDKTVLKIEKFLNLSDKDHIKKKQFFNPNVSIKNIGIWKKYKNQKIIDKIKEELPDYISEYSSR